MEKLALSIIAASAVVLLFVVSDLMSFKKDWPLSVTIVSIPEMDLSGVAVVNQGDTAYMAAIVTGGQGDSKDYEYTWQVSRDHGATWENIPNGWNGYSTHGCVLGIDTSFSDDAAYRCVVDDGQED